MQDLVTDSTPYFARNFHDNRSCLTMACPNSYQAMQSIISSKREFVSCLFRLDFENKIGVQKRSQDFVGKQIITANKCQL